MSLSNSSIPSPAVLIGSDRLLRLRDGRMLGYAEYGDPDGRPILFFHGTPSSRRVRPPHHEGVRVIVPDRPGMGLSDFQPGRTMLDWPSDVMELADHLGLERFPVAGVSGGGPYVAACAYKIAHRLTATAMICSGGPSTAKGALEGITPIRRIGFAVARHSPFLLQPLVWLVANPRRDPEGFFKKFGHGLHGPDQEVMNSPEVRSMLVGTYKESVRQGLRGIAWEVRLVGRPWGFRLEDIRIPVDLWHGEKDASTPIGMARAMAEAIPRSRPHFFEGEGHWLFYRHWPEIVLALG